LEAQKLSIIITTFDKGEGHRTGCFTATIKALSMYLKQDDLDVLWIIADDGSPKQSEHLKEATHYLAAKDQTFIITDSDRQGVGKSKNIALEKAFEFSNYVLLLEDDWLANVQLDLLPYIKILEQHSSIGMIRFGYLGGDIVAKLASYNDITFWELLSGMYVYSGQVSLRSKRGWYDVIGYHAEGLTPGQEEENWGNRYGDAADKPKILFPAQYGTTLNAFGSIFKNVGMDYSLNNVQPGT